MSNPAFASSKSSGKCGKNAKWSYDTAKGVLVISGKGRLNQWKDESKIPWRKYSNAISTVQIKKGIENIPDCSFSSCKKLKRINIANSVTEIGEYAFEDCVKLSSISIPSSVKKIGKWAFINTPWLKNKGDFAIVNSILVSYQGNESRVTVPSGVKTIGPCAFAEDDDYEQEIVGQIILPKGLKKIDNWGLAYCSISNIVIPNSVTYIGEWAFESDWALKTVTIGKGVKTIDAYAFYDCELLNQIYIPKNVKKVGSRAFGFWGDLGDIVLEGAEMSKVDGFTIKGKSGSAAQKYAKKFKFKFKSVK